LVGGGVRSYEEIQTDVGAAILVNDAEALRTLVQELQTLGTDQSEVSALSALGTIDKLIGNHAAALEHFRRALAMVEELGNRASVANVIANMALVYMETVERWPYTTNLEISPEWPGSSATWA
jgi:tetratricopeptide (TPR) repeat protein